VLDHSRLVVHRRFIHIYPAHLLDKLFTFRIFSASPISSIGEVVRRGHLQNFRYILLGPLSPDGCDMLYLHIPRPTNICIHILAGIGSDSSDKMIFPTYLHHPQPHLCYPHKNFSMLSSVVMILSIIDIYGVRGLCLVYHNLFTRGRELRSMTGLLPLGKSLSNRSLTSNPQLCIINA
jgi:hypothetical protein